MSSQNVIDHYQFQEKKLAEFIDKVPFIDTNHNVISPYLFDIYLNSGTGLDTLFKIIAKWPNFNKIKDIKTCYQKRPNVIKYIKIIEPIFQLKEIKVIFPKVTYNGDPYEFKPFEDMALIDPRGHTWEIWKIYSGFKHNWIDKLPKVTLMNTLRFCGAYFALMCVNPTSNNYFILRNRGILKTSPLVEPPDYPFVLRVADMQKHWIKKPKDRIVKRGKAFNVIFNSELFRIIIPVQIEHEQALGTTV